MGLLRRLAIRVCTKCTVSNSSSFVSLIFDLRFDFLRSITGKNMRVYVDLGKGEIGTADYINYNMISPGQY
jgi:hypothetical protein